MENIVFKSAIETLPSHLIDARIPFNFQLPVQFHLLERGINTDTDLPLLCTTDPVDLIFNGLTIKRPKPKIKEKLLELGLATDRKDLRKKRSRKSNHGECVHSLSLSLLSRKPPLCPQPFLRVSEAALKHPLFRPILSHSIRICLSYRPSATIPIRSVFSANTIASDRVRLNSVFGRRRHLTRAELKKVNWWWG